MSDDADDADHAIVSVAPTEGLSYDPSEPVYWDADALAGELTRSFELCHGCRMCFKYCDSFPILFRAIDDDHDGDVRKLTEADTARVMDACFQCKLCEVQCPYTPRDGHAFQLDFPKLVHRYRAQRARREGTSRRARILGDPDRTAKLARRTLGLANVMNRVKLHRWFMEKMLGVDRRKLLPSFARQTFSAWAEREDKLGDPGGEVVLFQTCYVEHNEPQIGRDTVEVFERNGVDVRCAEGFACCGMPAWESGNLEALRERARTNLDVLGPYVDAGAKVVAINPTCSMMLRREYPELVADEDRARAEKVAEATMDAGEMIWGIRKEERFNTDFASSPEGAVAYHAPCHLRAQAVGFKGRDLMRKIPGVQPRMVMECCGHDGTYAMTTEGFEPSIRVGENAFEGMKAVDTEIWATDCPLAALQFEQHAGVRPMHPMTLLARAYRGDPFGDEAADGDDGDRDRDDERGDTT